jgi:CheY-like chemotaxis protein
MFLTQDWFQFAFKKPKNYVAPIDLWRGLMYLHRTPYSQARLRIPPKLPIHMPKTAKTADRRVVLIVEDSVDFSNLLKFIVEDEGFEGLQFPLHLDDICAYAKEHAVSAVLMDLALGRKGGMAYIEMLKADPETTGLPILIITGRDLPMKEILELQQRGIRYLRKGRVEMGDIRKGIVEAASQEAPVRRKKK